MWNALCLLMLILLKLLCQELYSAVVLTTPYLLTPWSRVLLEKLSSFQIVMKFPEFYGTQRFITAVTSAHHLSLS
jgi:hypothetical protein